MKHKKVKDLVPTDIIYIPSYSKLGIVLLKERDNKGVSWYRLKCLVDSSVKTINTYGLQEVMSVTTVR